MTKTEIESELDKKIIETWNQPAQTRIEKMASRLMQRLVVLDQTKSPELTDFDLAA